MRNSARQARLAILVMILMTAAGAVPGRLVAAQVSIPLCQGLVVVTAVNQSGGDYESIKRVEAVTPDRVKLSYDGGEKKLSQLEGGGVKRIGSRRTILRQDLEHATRYAEVFLDGDVQPEVMPGTTAIGLSSDLYRQLKTTGHAPFKVADPSSSPNFHPANDDGTGVPKLAGTLQRVGTEMFKVVVNGEMVALPALHAKANFGSNTGEVWILDDPANPLALRYELFGDRLQVVRIICHCEGMAAPAGTPGRLPPGTGGAPGSTAATTGAAPGDGQSSGSGSLEQRLTDTGHATVYDIYFDFNSDSIRAASEPTLREIAGVLKRHPDWSLAVEGHTDNIGGGDYNLKLSARRAAAVKKALVGGFGVADRRLSTSGYGLTRPVDTNETLEGRAHNRRVELQRH